MKCGSYERHSRGVGVRFIREERLILPSERMNALKNTPEKGGERGYYAETRKWICGITNDFWEEDSDWT